MNTPELQLNDSDDDKHDGGPWPRLVINETTPGKHGECVVCGGVVHWQELVFVASHGLLCDGCARTLAPAAFALARHVIHMAEDDLDAATRCLGTLTEWLEERVLW